MLIYTAVHNNTLYFLKEFLPFLSINIGIYLNKITMVITFKTLLCLPTFLNFTFIRLGAPLFLVVANRLARPWPTKSELRCAYYGRNKARIFNGAIDSANLKKFTLNQLHLLAKWKRKM
jgi:hypothetical protein